MKTLTVGELRERLAKFPSKAPVYITSDDGDIGGEAISVALERDMDGKRYTSIAFDVRVNATKERNPT